MNQQQTKQLLGIARKLLIFKDMGITEVEPLIRACAYRTYAPLEVVYRIDEPSREMLILLAGKLQVLSKSGIVLGEILPGTCCGEMGVFTGLSRSSTIVSTAKSAGLVLGKQDMEIAFKADLGRQTKVLRNIIVLLCGRLLGADRKVETYAEDLRHAKEEIELLGGEVTEGEED